MFRLTGPFSGNTNKRQGIIGRLIAPVGVRMEKLDLIFKLGVIGHKDSRLWCNLKKIHIYIYIHTGKAGLDRP